MKSWPTVLTAVLSFGTGFMVVAAVIASSTPAPSTVFVYRCAGLPEFRLTCKGCWSSSSIFGLFNDAGQRVHPPRDCMVTEIKP